ncbi:hypothetical protein OG946_14265 [Streptomyces sp. NBC_01808]|uniref:hypothetical protein n=1 Tax=Streptomyces sp. NBC_01808 TaxID=2975947 RepID=UPI002DDB87F2|nr:hypothetical protein [Streptomyces sp. NBC_01808]WSA38438.1 hypothetical protein OG946_14265 [Streptomyces sp. NBC_01808]
MSDSTPRKESHAHGLRLVVGAFPDELFDPRPVRRLPAPPPPHLVPVLAELSRGTPDTVACRNLHLSPRTYSRRVAELLECLGAESRFQGGAQAVRRGWLVGACLADTAEGG